MTYDLPKEINIDKKYQYRDKETMTRFSAGCVSDR